MRIIFAPIDFSPISEKVVESGAELARRFGAELHLIHVGKGDPSSSTTRPAAADELPDERQKLESWQQRLQSEDVRCTTSLQIGRVVEHVLEESAAEQADVIVLGSHGRSAMYKSMVGSVAEGILKGARCPVFVIPPERGS